MEDKYTVEAKRVFKKECYIFGVALFTTDIFLELILHGFNDLKTFSLGFLEILIWSAFCFSLWFRTANETRFENMIAHQKLKKTLGQEYLVELEMELEKVKIGRLVSIKWFVNYAKKSGVEFHRNQGYPGGTQL